MSIIIRQDGCTKGSEIYSKRYGQERLINACQRALSYNASDYTTLKNILAKGLDLIQEHPVTPLVHLPKHDNIRGSQYYQ